MERRIGGHVSAAGGFLEAIKEARRIGANTIQIFGASPVRWNAKLPEKNIAQKFRSLCEEHDIQPIFLHAPYLINLASPKDSLAKMSQRLLSRHLEIANSLGAFGVIFHIGSHGSRPPKEAKKMVAECLLEIISDVSEGRLIIENSAGAGNLVGDTLEEVGGIMDRIRDKRVGFCLDTAHAFESGILDDFSPKNIDRFFKKLDEKIGHENLWAIHLNDSKTPAGSNRDRHENIGEGYIGKEGLGNFLNFGKIAKIPLILEVPGFDGEGPDRKNISAVESLIK